jgi:hypothetical protein
LLRDVELVRSCIAFSQKLFSQNLLDRVLLHHTDAIRRLRIIFEWKRICVLLESGNHVFELWLKWWETRLDVVKKCAGVKEFRTHWVYSTAMVEERWLREGLVR